MNGYRFANRRFFVLKVRTLAMVFTTAKNFLPLDYNDGIHIIQTGLRLRLPIPIDPGHMAFHFRPMYAYFWNDNNSAIPEGKDREGRSEFSKTWATGTTTFCF